MYRLYCLRLRLSFHGAITVKKVWNDKENQDGKRPESLTVQLKNGETVSGTYHPEESMFTEFDDLTDPSVEGF